MAGSIYSSVPDLNVDPTRLIELTDNASAPGVVDTSVTDSTSLDAQDVIDRRLEGTYVVPFTAGNVPPAIRRLHSKIWKRMLYERRDAMQVPKAVEDDYARALDDLEDYATPGDGGRFLLGAQQHSGAGQAASAGAFSSDPDDNNPVVRLFGRAKDRLG